MRSIKLVVVNSIVWLIAHLIIASSSAKMSNDFFERNGYLFKTFKFERSGELWNYLFKVKRWKAYLPDGSKIIKNSVSKSELPDFNIDTLNTFIIEMRRAEFTHWMSMLPAPLFFLFTPRFIAWINVFYAFFSNFPFIITQRYNRPKVEKLYYTKLDRSIRVMKERKMVCTKEHEERINTFN